MPDIVLKIYSTSTTWGDTLDHTIFGDVVDYEIMDNSNYEIDTAWFKINDNDHRWSDQITPDHYTGAAENTQIWRAFSRNDTLINSGVVSKVYKQGNNIIIEGYGMSALLLRKVVEDEYFQTKDGAGTAISGDYILTDSTYGLIPSYLSTTYGTIGVSTYVTTPTTTQSRFWKFDGWNLWDCAVDVARASYGSNSNPYDVYLFETYTAPSTFTRELYFQEIESTAKAKTVVMSDVIMGDFNLAEHARENYNRVVVRGAPNPNGFRPNPPDDIFDDYLINAAAAYTHDGGDGAAFFEDSGATMVTDGGVTGMYVSNLDDGCVGRITTLTETKATLADGIWGGNQGDFDDNENAYVGYWYANAETDDGSWDMTSTTSTYVGGPLNISCTRTDTTNRILYVVDLEQLGYTIDQRFHTLRFDAIGLATGAGSKEFRAVLGVKDKYGNENSQGNPANIDDFSEHLSYIVNMYCDTSFTDSHVYNAEIPLPKPNLGNDWKDATTGIDTSGIQQREWFQISQLGFYLDDDANEDITNIYLGNIRFIGDIPYEGSNPTTPPSFSREYIHRDNGLQSTTDCNNLAQNILTGLNKKQWQGNITLKGVKRDFTLKAGNTVEIVIPSKTINIQAGETQSKLGTQAIRYTPNTQELTVGRIYSTNEIVNNIARGWRLTNKTI